MGMAYEVRDNLLIIRGGRPLKAAQVTALDLRAGAALMLAGMLAEGETCIQSAWQIERGYCDLGRKLRQLGADVTL